MSIKAVIKTNPLTKGPYRMAKKVKDKKKFIDLFSYHGEFENRQHGYRKLCIILAGYKDFLYEPVFGRIKKNLTDDIDVCVVSSGLYSSELHSLCEDNNWSYLSTKENDVSLVQNVAIRLHPKAKYIFKLDEDIFITDHFFERMMNVYRDSLKSDYDPGVIAPLLLVNGYSTLRILRKLELEDVYTDKFGRIKHAAGPDKSIECNVEAARFMWGEGGYLPHLDDINALFYKNPKSLTACPIRFSIGAIMFSRKTWEQMKYFDVDRSDKFMMGKDEVKLCNYCCINSKPIIVSDNIVVGHFSFGPQTEGMKTYFKEHPERFMMKDNKE